MPKGGFNF